MMQKKHSGLQKNALVLPSSFKLSLGGASRNQKGVKSAAMKAQKEAMTESFLKACGVKKKDW